MDETIAERIDECARNAEALVPALLALAEQVEKTEVGRETLDRIVELAVVLRSDLRRLARVTRP